MATFEDILSESSKIEKIWDFIIETLQQIKFEKGDILEFKIPIVEATINETHQRIQQISIVLVALDTNLTQKDIDDIYEHVKTISQSSQSIEEEVKKIKNSSGYPHMSFSVKDNLYYQVGRGFNYFKPESHITSILKTYDEVMSIFKKYPNLAAIIKIFLLSNDSQEIKKLKSMIKESEENIKEFLSNENTMKQQREEELKKIKEIKKSVETARGQIIVSDITKALLSKKRWSMGSLVVATTLYLAVLVGFLFYLQNYLPDIASTLKTSLELEGTFELVTARILLISPYALLIIFASKYYNRAFRRSEYYASKFIIASLIDGFKDQAEGQEYKNAIASTVFSELLLDPADYLDRMEKRKKEKESVIASLIDRIKGEELEKLRAELEKLKAGKTTPPTPE